MTVPATLHHLADALTALRLAHDATADLKATDWILVAEQACLRALEQAARAAMTEDFDMGDE